MSLKEAALACAGMLTAELFASYEELNESKNGGVEGAVASSEKIITAWKDHLHSNRLNVLLWR